MFGSKKKKKKKKKINGLVEFVTSGHIFLNYECAAPGYTGDILGKI
jgi:hypothetical protein